MKAMRTRSEGRGIDYNYEEGRESEARKGGTRRNENEVLRKRGTALQFPAA